jgi:aminoglycoside 2''-phosphotransferase
VLTPEGAAEAIRSRFPDVDARNLRHLGSGWEFDAYLTGDGWVFRFPRRAEYAGRFERDRSVHELVAGPLAPVAVPRVELLGSGGPAFPYPFAGHQLVPGVEADDAVIRRNPRFAAELGAAITAIHSVPAAAARAAGVGRDDEGAEDWLREVREVAHRLDGLGSSTDVALDWVRRAGVPPAPYPGPDVLLHNDLCPDHILCDPTTGRLTGIIDWTDAALGDPALDFAGMAAWWGWSLVEDALAHYPLPLDDAFGERLAFLARLLSLVWLDDAVRQAADGAVRRTADGSLRKGVDVGKHVRWVENAFG